VVKIVTNVVVVDDELIEGREVEVPDEVFLVTVVNDGSVGVGGVGEEMLTLDVGGLEGLVVVTEGEVVGGTRNLVFLGIELF
jgi:hypothetical protein